MITKATIKNFMGIEKEVQINCLANNKIKRKKVCYSYSKTFDDVNILKTIGIIGSNGSGKTSILNAFLTLQTFVNFPFRRSTKDQKSFIEQIKKLPEETLRQIMDDFNTLKLGLSNINHIDEDTFIELEMYIPESKNVISGYYTYSILYDNNYKINGVKNEKLLYRKKYKSTKGKVIFDVHNVIESELGTKILYENNTLNVSEDNSYFSYYKSVGTELINNLDFIFFGDSYDLTSFFKNHHNEFISLAKIADEKICNVKVEKRNNNEANDKLIFLNKENNKLYFEQLSTGTKKVIVLGSRLIESILNNHIIFIDELETSLHPALAEFLLSIIQRNNKKTFSQLFFTTHSIFLASTLDNDQLYYIDNKNFDYKMYSINDAIKHNIITKDRTLMSAVIDNLLINNPNFDRIKEFIDMLNNQY